MPETNLNPHFRNYDPRAPFPNFQKPHIIDGFSLEQDRSFARESRKYLKYWRPPVPGSFDIDLNAGYDSYVPGPKEVQISSMLEYIRKTYKDHLDSSGRRLAADFICYRGLLTQIIVSPYFTRDSWSILATRFNGTIYLCNYVSPEKQKESEARDTEYSLRCCYYGKNFERFVLTEDPTVKEIPPVEGPLKDVEEFNMAITTKLEGMRILYTAEMDGVDDIKYPAKSPNPDLNDLRFVEVKTRMRDQTEQQFRNYVKWKLPKWWCQSFLVGVETIHTGFRTKDGHVKEMESLAVRDIPKIARDSWSPAVMMRFGADFLATVADLMVDVDCPHTVYQFNYDSSRNWKVTYEVLEGKSHLSILPQKYIDVVEQERSGNK